MKNLFLTLIIFLLYCSNVFASNAMETYIYSFTIVADTDSCYITNISPASGSVNVAQDTSISSDILDHDTGVDIDSIVCKVNGINVTITKTPTTVNGDDGFHCVYEPVSDFLKGSLVNVSWDAKDLAL